MVAGSGQRRLRKTGTGSRRTPPGGRTGSGQRRPASRRHSASQHRGSTALQVLARGGLVARGVIYVLIGFIAIQVAFGSSGRQADKTGALRLVGQSLAGEVALWLLVAGFAGLTLWRLWEAAAGASGPDGDKTTKRLAALASGVCYGVLDFGVLKYALGLGAPKSSGKQSRDLTATALHYPGGQVLVAIAGIALVAGGGYVAYRAWRKKFLEGMPLDSVSPKTRRGIELLGQAGGVARGVIAVTTGIFLFIAAVKASPSKAKGVDSALLALARTPAGPWLLVAVAIGLLMYGAFSGCEARYRDV